MKLVPYLLFAIALAGCAHMHIVCQDAGSTTLAVGGNTAGQQILTQGLIIGGAAAHGAGFMAPAPKDTAPTPQSQSYVDYQYAPIFGPDYASCSTLPPPTPPSTSIVTMQTPPNPPSVVTVQSGQVVFAPPQTKP